MIDPDLAKQQADAKKQLLAVLNALTSRKEVHFTTTQNEPGAGPAVRALRQKVPNSLLYWFDGQVEDLVAGRTQSERLAYEPQPSKHQKELDDLEKLTKELLDGYAEAVGQATAEAAAEQAAARAKAAEKALQRATAAFEETTAKAKAANDAAAKAKVDAEAKAKADAEAKAKADAEAKQKDEK